MRPPTILRLAASSALLASTALLALGAAPASASEPVAPAVTECLTPGDAVHSEAAHSEAAHSSGAVSSAARGPALERGGHGLDHRAVGPAEQRAIERRTAKILAGKGKPGGDSGGAGGQDPQGGTIPTYVHVMAAKNGAGDVSDGAIRDQVAVLDQTYAGTGFDFTLAGIDRYYNTTWHQDRSSSKYRSATRRGGADALNIWLVDFDYLGVATFPWDYARNGDIDGIRVNYASLPGGGIDRFDLGRTATHEAGHWLGLYHTFQGGCALPNDEVGDTPAQSSPSSGCPVGRDSCSLPGSDPIRNYMDYSDDACYDNFTGGQTTRMQQMFGAYRA